WDAGTRAHLVGEGGAEALILEGDVSVADEVFGRHDWIRLPAGHAAELIAGPKGARLWIKRDHLRTIRNPAQVA
ncbi:MAG: cupin, partial [Pseudomonadota bacterium]